MKSVSYIVKYFIIPVSSIIGILYSFDNYIIERAKTVVEPTTIKVESIKIDLIEIKDRTKNIEKILMSRGE